VFGRVVQEKFLRNTNELNSRELVIIGGVSVGDQTRVLRQGVDIIVATPGRLEELIGSGEIDLTHMRFFILDEAVKNKTIAQKTMIILYLSLLGRSFKSRL